MSHNSVCFMNPKGGVGKSTLSVAFAEYLAFAQNNKILFIDGDPQCNSTVMSVGPHEPRILKRTVGRLYVRHSVALLGLVRSGIGKSERC
jgi:cellulose biosynthesis protein BcsQ